MVQEKYLFNGKSIPGMAGSNNSENPKISE
jgi:hypothetical protein